MAQHIVVLNVSFCTELHVLSVRLSVTNIASSFFVSRTSHFLAVSTHDKNYTRSPAVAVMADRTAHSRRSVQKLWRIHLAMLIYRDIGVKVRIRIIVPVRVNPVQITSRYWHSSRKTKPNPNTKRNPNPINTCVPVTRH